MIARKYIVLLIAAAALVVFAYRLWPPPPTDQQDRIRAQAAGIIGRPGWLGIGWHGVLDLKTGSAIPTELWIECLVSGSPADRVGLRIGDIIVGLNGQAFGDALQLQDKVAQMRIGEKLTLNIRRDGQPLSFEMVLVSYAELVDLARRTGTNGFAL